MKFDFFKSNESETYSFLLPEDGDGELKLNAMISSTIFSIGSSSKRIIRPHKICMLSPRSQWQKYE